MKTMRATDLRPGVRRVVTATAEEVTHLRDRMVRIKWSNGEEQTVQPDAEIEVEDA